jgi:hypothetical protein
VTQDSGQWDQQGDQQGGQQGGQYGGYPPQEPGRYPPRPQQPAGYPPSQQPGGFPPQQPAGFPPQPSGYQPQGGYPPQAPPGGYPPQAPPGGYPPQAPPGGYPPQQPGAFAAQGAGGFPSGPGAPPKKSPVMIIAIVAAAIVLLAAIGGIIMVLTRGATDQPEVTITPSQPVPPTEEPTPGPTEQPTPEPQPSPTEPSEPPTRGSVDLGNGIELLPAGGWEVKKTGQNVAQLSDGTNVFLGQSLQISQSTNPGQLCEAWHRKIAEGTTNGKFQDSKDADVGTTRLQAATCVAQVTVSGGQGSAKLFLFSLVSVRQSDGVSVIGTTYFTADSNTEQLNKDFTSMINSMLRSQAAGG